MAEDRIWPGDSSPEAYSAAGGTGRPTRQAGSRLEQERRLSDAGLPAHENERTGDQAATEHAVEFADAEAAAREIGFRDVGESGGLRGSVPGRSRPGRPRRLTDDRLDQAVPLPTRPTLAFPSGERLRAQRWQMKRLCGRAIASGRRVGGAGHRASTAVRGSARWMSRPASGSLSTMMVEPGSYLPSRRCSARTSSIMFWITRRSGRAP